MTRKHGTRNATRPDSTEEHGPTSSEHVRLLRENERLVVERQAAELVSDEYIDLYEIDPLPSLTLDAGYVVRRANRAMLELVALESNGFLKQSLRRFVLNEDRRTLSTHLAKAAKGSLERCRLRLAAKEGPSIPVELWTKALARTGLYQIRMVDLREREQAELEMRRLAQSERAARDQNAAKDTFIAMLSHELRAPLTPALAAASRFRDQSLPESVQKAFVLIRRGILAEVRMIDDLLDVNRIVRGKMSVTCRTASVHEIVREAAAMLSAEAEAKKQTVELALDAEHHCAQVDAVRLRQVFWNLIRNAIKFTGAGGRISVRSWNSDELLMVEVADDGRGIDAANLSRLFAPFDQLDRNRSEAGGLGLGLTISRGLMELHGGGLTAHSGGLGRGARFVAALGTVEPPQEATTSSSEASVEPPRAPPAEQLDVLLVEDHADTLEIMSEVLQDAGFRVHTAASAAEAKRVDLDAIDLIVCDLGLPDQSGLELIAELQAKRRRPALALSGYGMDADIRASKAAGFDEHLVKPVDVHRVVETLHKLALGPA